MKHYQKEEESQGVSEDPPCIRHKMARIRAELWIRAHRDTKTAPCAVDFETHREQVTESETWIGRSHRIGDVRLRFVSVDFDFERRHKGALIESMTDFDSETHLQRKLDGDELTRKAYEALDISGLPTETLITDVPESTKAADMDPEFAKTLALLGIG